MSELSWMDRVRFLLTRGSEVSLNGEIPTEENADGAIELLTFAANKSPKFLLRETIISGGSAMMSLSLAVLFAQATNEFLSEDYVKEVAYELLVFKEPSVILEFVEYLKSKQLGRGFGSRPQKIIRRVMEAWQVETIEKYILNHQDEMKSLVRLVHPRYNDYHGELIRLLMDDDL